MRLRAAVSDHDPLLEALLLLLLLLVALGAALRCWCSGLAWLLHFTDNADRDLQLSAEFCSIGIVGREWGCWK
jgi:hypothetical protein